MKIEDYLLFANLFNLTFCLVMLVYTRVVLQTRINSASRRSFKKFVVIVIACVLADMCSYIFDTRTFVGAKELNHASMFLAVLLTCFVGYYWNHMFDYLFHIKRERRAKLVAEVLYALPMAAAAVFLIMNVYNGMFFTISDENVYARGELYVLSFGLQYVMFIVSLVRAVLLRRKLTEAPMKREKMRRTFVHFSIAVIGFGACQWAMNGKIALHCLGLTAGVIIMFVRFLDDQITQDRLTGLNNRYALDTYLYEKTEAHRKKISPGTRLYLIMMDVDNFKSINDKHGHIEGDNALKLLASSLKTVASKYKRKLFVSRYGGDEFCAVLEAQDDASVILFVERLKYELSENVKHLEYRVRISEGHSVYTDGMAINEWITAADRDLYKNRNREIS